MKSLIAQWVREHFYLWLGAAGLFLSLGAGFIVPAPQIGATLIVLAAAVGFLGVRLRESREADRKVLSAALAEVSSVQLALQDHAARVNALLTEAMGSLLGSYNQSAHLLSDARVSLYRLEVSEWNRVARFSRNYSYMNGGRESLPLRQGILHQGHLLGEYFIDNLADSTQDAETYFAEQRELGVPKGTVRAFGMRSRCYAAFAIDRLGTRDRGLVVVFESTDANGLDMDTLRSVLNDDAQRLTAELTAALNAYAADGLPRQIAARA